ncbi:MAG: thioredoxin-disulfide reductase [Candidatus Tectomicrobia bacterium]|uniref:Thioredoxin reductase n=1 Tax=Tectimicrobiota bacterium TaxID=2528274 RepID=A0A932M0B1_UNCTE|nr:thioredoxin-disulfide reductase [Candidatus Tectomicrobia bacterium]
MALVEVYTKSNCPYCRLAKVLLREKGVHFTETDVTDDSVKREEARERSGRQTVPQIFVSGKSVGGYDDLRALERRGELNSLLEIRPASKPREEGKEHAVIIVGSGPAGLTAAIYAARANLAPLVISGAQPGGQLTITTDVENYPGFPRGILGPELMEEMKKQAERFGTTFVSSEVSKIDLSRRPYTIEADGDAYRGKTIIIASGASARFLGLPSEQKLLGHGVSACATCDGFFFKDQDVVVVGGGDTAMEESLFLTKFARTVTVVHRRDKLRASKVMQDRAHRNSKIRFIWNSGISEVLDAEQGKVVGVRLRNLKTGEVSELPCEGVFIAIGHTPNTGFLRGLLEMDSDGYLITREGVKTSVPGVFAAGDVVDRVYRQAITAAGMGCMAAMAAERFLESEEE